MRILMTADTVGGVWSYALELARALAPAGVEVELATMGRLPTEAQRAAATKLPNVRLHPSPFRLEWMESPWEDVARAGDWLLDLERRLRPDLIHLNGYAHGALPWSAPALIVAHSCVLSWWRAVHGEPAPADWDRYREAVGRGLRAAALVVAPTRAMLAMLEAEHGPLAAARVIPNARDAARFPPARKQALVLAAGRVWDAAKNIAALAAVAPELPWPVYVAGEERAPGSSAPGAPGPAPGEQRAGLRPLGFLDEPTLAKWLGRAALFVAPARYEPFGLSILEAAYAGCALVLGDIPSLREVWGDAACFVSPDDPDALRAALLRLIEDAEGRRHLGAQARARAFEYTPERMAHGYLSAYRALSPEAAGRPAASLAGAGWTAADGLAEDLLCAS